MEVTLPRATLWRVFWRSLFLQAAWNRRGMQNLGFAYAIAPALRRLYPERERRRAALRRHLSTFNCHPYTAAAIVGGAIHHEERVAAGEEPESAPLEYKQVLQGPLAAVGDGFFWAGLRPFAGALAAVGVLAVGWPALLAVIVLYNAVQLWVRFSLFRVGYRYGDAVVDRLAALSLPAWGARLRSAGTLVAGAGVTLLAARSVGGAGRWATAVAIAAALAGWWVLSRGRRLLPSAYGAMLLGTLLGAALGQLGGGP
ncbi:MAG TPA: PTS system mannose/fructose/sorbose family transporter subunit IID [Anaeromyxobacteraceae bacterium]|nr:PTS system mannose/fructose/sorbose family transporter subunit IID [Anaeromyxobacteraceae bacterium]